jgi:hypothetical protein
MLGVLRSAQVGQAGKEGSMTEPLLFGPDYYRRKREAEDQIATKQLLCLEVMAMRHPDAAVFDDRPMIGALQRLQEMQRP